MTPAEIMASFSERGRLPREALDAAGQCREEMIPEFLAIIDRLRQANIETATENDLSAFLFVFFLLGEWCESRAYRPLISLLRGDPELLEALIGDGITEGTARVVAGVCDGDLQPIFELARDAEADSFVRSQMFDALVVLALADPLKRPPVKAFLSDFLAGDALDTPSHVWSACAFSAAALGFTDLVPEVRQLYEDQQIEPDDSNFAYFEQCLQKTLDEGQPAWFERRNNARPIDSAIDELSRWYCFSPEFLDRESRVMAEIGDPATFLGDTFQRDLPKVGRNDPCPCGSGKKFKKCCLN